MNTSFRVLLISFTILLVTQTSLYTQNCNNDSTGLIPISNLLEGYYNGFQGGLYFGSNTKPAKHSINLNKVISNITPLNNDGISDPTNGKLVLLSIGASNPKTEFEAFMKIADTLVIINPYLTIVNGCVGGKSLQKIKDSTENYWKSVSKELSINGVNPKQVQIIWLEEDNTQTKNYDFPSAPLELMSEFKELFKTLLHFYPNLQICYLNGRGYSGYVDELSTAGPGLRYPRDYYNGWTLKWLIEDQINGDTTLNYMGVDRKAPLLDWSAYLWTDGNIPRNDGLFWECPTDFKPEDGLHWSPIGNIKAAEKIFERFSTDAEARKWFLDNSKTSVTNNSQNFDFQVFPNPSNNFFQIEIEFVSKLDAYIYNTIGQLVQVDIGIMNNHKVNHNLPNGIYQLLLKNDKNIIIKSTQISVNR